MMKTKNKLFLGIVIILLAVNAYYYVLPKFSSSEKNLTNSTPELSLTANHLAEFYKNNEEESNLLYAGKILEITGTIKEITFLNDRTTVILNSSSKSFGVICDIHPNDFNKINKFKINDAVTIKGICKGFLKDVILLNCTIDLPTNE